MAAKKRPNQPGTFEARATKRWRDEFMGEWHQMPACENRDLRPWKRLEVQFSNAEDLEAFGKLIGDESVVETTPSLWYPPQDDLKVFGYMRWVSRDPARSTPRYPIYVISKGRADTRLTSKALEKIGVPYHIVVEPPEYEQYARVIDPKKILVTPFENLGQGSIPVRNFVWEHAVATGAERHWVLDDNIRAFLRFHLNQKVPYGDGTGFRVVEDWADRYENLAEAGMQYYMFVPRRELKPPFYLNTRIYSAILLRNDVYPEFAWRGTYNEDTDLSLRLLKAGHCTALFNSSLAYKMPTMKMKGGNMDELYQGEGRLDMAQSLVDQHPDVVRLQKRFGRYQHLVDYRPFKANLLRRKPEFRDVPEGIDEYGLVFEYRESEDQPYREMDPRYPMRQYYPLDEPLSDNGSRPKRKPRSTTPVVPAARPAPVDAGAWADLGGA